jgi:hypothetical protein
MDKGVQLNDPERVTWVWEVAWSMSRKASQQDPVGREGEKKRQGETMRFASGIRRGGVAVKPKSLTP